MPSLSGDGSLAALAKFLCSKQQIRKQITTRYVASWVKYLRAWPFNEFSDPVKTVSSTPSTRPVMSSSCVAAESRIVTTVGVVEKYIITAMKKVVPCESCAMLIEFIPAVRVETVWKKALPKISWACSPLKAGLWKSWINITIVPRTLRPTTTSISHIVWTAGNMCVKHRRGCSMRKSRTFLVSEWGRVLRLQIAAISRTMIGSPVFPKMIRAPMVVRRIGLLTKSMTDDGVMTKPLF
mmetsp:Transcript_108549/g.259127  ORF Transcript_108549/g.259127 Transcript_108549/m.259127 type:complete len:238 (-) Transcript_108549:407-1120(-)